MPYSIRFFNIFYSRWTVVLRANLGYNEIIVLGEEYI